MCAYCKADSIVKNGQHQQILQALSCPIYREPDSHSRFTHCSWTNLLWVGFSQRGLEYHLMKAKSSHKQRFLMLHPATSYVCGCVCNSSEFVHTHIKLVIHNVAKIINKLEPQNNPELGSTEIIYSHVHSL